MLKLIFLVSLLNFSTSYAQSDDIKRFKKCYSLFTSQPIYKDHYLVKKIQNNQSTGTQACMELLSKANFLSDNRIKKESSGEYPREAQRVLRNIHFLHRSFFEITNYFHTIDGYPNLKGEEQIFDDNADAYYWTYNFFKENEKVSSIVKVPYSYYGLRYSKNQSTAKKIQIGSHSGKLASIIAWPESIPVVEQGLLVGIEKDQRSHIVNFDELYWFKHLTGSDAFAHFGAGIIGSQVYIFKNFGKYGKRHTSDGGLDVYRRWSKNVMKDLLCRELPALRAVDVEAEVSSSSPLFFRNSTSCMQCHSSMDPMAGNVRHIVTGGVNTAFRPFMAGTYHNEEKVNPSYSSILPEESDNKFHLTPPIGRLKYRSYSGELVEQNTSSLADLGSKIAQSNDFYVCTAKKYYRYLTGIEVSLADPGAPGANKLSVLEQKHRDRVIALGLSLKGDKPYMGKQLDETQKENLQWLVEKIIDTKTFVSPEIFE